MNPTRTTFHTVQGCRGFTQQRTITRLLGSCRTRSRAFYLSLRQEPNLRICRVRGKDSTKDSVYERRIRFLRFQTQQLRRPVTIRLGVDVIDYFRAQAEETGIPYQTLINLYPKDCVRAQRKLEMQWAA